MGKIEFISAGGIVVNKKKQIVLVRNLKGYWGFPKGHIEEGEDELTAAKREIYEESGVKKLTLINDIGALKHLKSSKIDNSTVKTEKYIKMFLFRGKKKKLKPIDPDNPEAKWFYLNDAIKMLKHQEDKNFFLKIKKEFFE